MKKNLILIPFLSLALLVVGCVDREAQAQAKRVQQVNEDKSIPVKTQVLSAQTVQHTLEITGTITTSEDTMIGAKIGGRVVAVYVKQGDHVAAGQIIAVQESSELRSRQRQAMAQVRAAESQLRQAMNDSRVGPTRSVSAVSAARARLQQSEAQLLRLRNGSRSEERAQSDAQLRAAKNNMETAKRDYERAQMLFKGGAIAQKDLDRAQNAYSTALSNYESAVEQNKIVNDPARYEDIKQATAAVEAARQSLNDALAQQQLDSQFQERIKVAQANLESAQESVMLANDALVDVSIRAPFSGQISDKPAQMGTYLGPGMVAAHIIGDGGFFFEGEVPETQISKIVPGSAVSIKVDALPNFAAGGKVLSIDPSSSSLGRLYKVRIQLDNVDKQLKTGMFARGVVGTETIPGAILVPVGAILKDASSQYVYLAEGTSVRRVDIKVNGNIGTNAIVSGLSSGQKLIVSGQTMVNSKSVIREETAGGI